MSVGPLCGHGSCSQTHISFVTVLESRKNAQVFIKTSHFSQAGPHGGHNARSSGPTNVCSSTSLVLPTGVNSGPAYGTPGTALGHSPAPSPGRTPCRRCLAHRPTPEPPPRSPQLSTPTTGPDSGPPRTPRCTPLTKRPRSPSPLWTGHEEADHG